QTVWASWSATILAVPLAPGGPGMGCTSSAVMLAMKLEVLASAGTDTSAGVTSASRRSSRGVRIGAILEGQEKLGEIGEFLVGEPEAEADGVVEGEDVVEQSPPGDVGSVPADVPVEGMASERPRQEVAGRRGVAPAAVVEIRRGEPQTEQRRCVEPGDGAVGPDLAGVDQRIAGHHDVPMGLPVG